MKLFVLHIHSVLACTLYLLSDRFHCVVLLSRPAQSRYLITHLNGCRLVFHLEPTEEGHQLSRTDVTTFHPFVPPPPPTVYRQTGQATTDELHSRDLRRELEEKERDSRDRKDREKTRSFTGELCGRCGGDWTHRKLRSSFRQSYRCCN